MSMPSRLAAIVLVVLTSWTPELSATLILAYRGGGEVVIAADSMRIVMTRPPVRIAACKILNFGDVVFTGAGDTTLPGDGFSIESITASLHEREGVGAETLRERIAKFDQEAITAFERLHEQRRTTRPVTFTYIVGFVREGQAVVHSRRLKSADGVAEIGEWEMLADGVVLVAGQPEVLDHLSAVRGPDRPGTRSTPTPGRAARRSACTPARANAGTPSTACTASRTCRGSEGGAGGATRRSSPWKRSRSPPRPRHRRSLARPCASTCSEARGRAGNTATRRSRRCGSDTLRAASPPCAPGRALSTPTTRQQCGSWWPGSPNAIAARPRVPAHGHAATVHRRGSATTYAPTAWSATACMTTPGACGCRARTRCSKAISRVCGVHREPSHDDNRNSA